MSIENEQHMICLKILGFNLSFKFNMLRSVLFNGMY